MGRIATLFSEQKVTLPIAQKQQMIALDKEFEALEAKVTELQAENLHLRAEIGSLKKEIERLKDQRQPESFGKLSDDDVCDHCGSPKLKRIGNRPNKTFGEMGTKDAIFTCLDCGKEFAYDWQQMKVITSPERHRERLAELAKHAV